MRTIVIISSASFFRTGPRVGMQFIAQTLARNGFDVHYVSQPSSPLDALSPGRWRRFQRAWMSKNCTRQVEPNLREYFVRTPFPVSKRFWLSQRQYDWYGCWLPRALKNMSFDLCLHDTSSGFPLLEHLNFNKVILRLNDHPEGFSFATSSIVINKLTHGVAAGRYAQTWPVSQALCDYANKLQPNGNHLLVSNGVDYQRFLDQPSKGPKIAKSAVFVGALERWCDLPLLDAAAKLLPDWQIDLYGPSMPGVRMTAGNIACKGPVDYRLLPEILGRYHVGLIPFREDPLVAVMDRPLKFYEYLAAGLGIASTDVGRLKEGMGAWARFGRTPAEFAGAIIQAADDAAGDLEDRHTFLAKFSWTRIGEQILACVEKVLHTKNPRQYNPARKVSQRTACEAGMMEIGVQGR